MRSDPGTCNRQIKTPLPHRRRRRIRSRLYPPPASPIWPPNLRPRIPLESPFLIDPSKYTFSAHQVVDIYLAALRKAQPSGLYVLGDWSADAVYAYELSRRLLDRGETVNGLILIDMKVPKPIPDGRQPTIESVKETGFIVGLTRVG